jgi:two-component system NtrC family sensor kinase
MGEPTDPNRWPARPHVGASVGRSLLLWITATTVAAFAAYSAVTLEATSRHWRRSIEADGERFAELILESTRYAMLLNRKEDLHELVRTVSEKPGVDGVRIYDKRGVVIASAEAREIGQQVDLEAEACVVCHRSGEVRDTLTNGDRTRVFQRPEGERILGVIHPIRNAPECSTGDCHAGADSTTLLGVLDVTMSMAEADRRIAAAGRNIWIAAIVVIVLVGFVSASFVDRVVRRPVARLTEGARRVAGGDLDSRIEIDRDDEIGELADAFNAMTADLHDARARLTEWSHDLEKTVVRKTEELARTQRHVAHVEKMASLGRLSATVAHELNNPLAGIVNYARLVERDLRENDVAPEARDEMLRCIELIRREAARSGDIVRNLLLFAKPSSGGRGPVNVGDVLERAVMLVRHHVEVHRIELTFEGAPGRDRLTCDPDQIQQAVVALMINAVEAMPDGGTLAIRVLPDDDDVRLEIEDSGVGIPDQVLPHIFEPFYSTKEGTSGLGLGLSVVYGIVRGHQGTVDVVSRPGEGTRITLTLPRDPSRKETPTDRPAVWEA